MKKFTYLIFGVILTTIYACKHENCCTLPQPSAHMTAQKNGAQWDTYYVISNLNEVDSLTIAASTVAAATGTNTKADSLNFKILYTDKKTYNLNPNQVFYTTFANGAATTYKLDPTYNNALNITGYQVFDNPATTNPNQVKITGTFNIKFIDPNNPSGISFSNGSFYTIMNH